MTNTGLQKEYDWNYEFSSAMTIPVVTLIGNHDALSNGVFIYKSMYGALNFTFEVAGNHYICWNNNNWEFGPGAPDWAWLESALDTAYQQVSTAGGQIHVLNHIPHNDPDRYSAADVERYRQLMSSYGVSSALNGHKHDHVYESVDGVDYVTVGSVQHLSYLKLTVTGPNREDFIIEKIDV